MSLEIKGKLLKILDVQNGTSKAGKDWSKQEFVIETEDQFPKKVCFTLFGDKVSLIKDFSVGDELEVAFNLESREYNSRWYHNINAWKITKTQSANNGPDIPPEIIPDAPEPAAGEINDDLPF